MGSFDNRAFRFCILIVMDSCSSNRALIWAQMYYNDLHRSHSFNCVLVACLFLLSYDKFGNSYGIGLQKRTSHVCPLGYLLPRLFCLVNGPIHDAGKEVCMISVRMKHISKLLNTSNKRGF